MDCEQAQSLLVADMDRELSRDDRVRLEAHLQACAACRTTGESFRLQDAALRRAFAPRRQVAARVASRAIAELRRRSVRARRRLPWVAMLGSAAAGFLLAVTLFRPWEKFVVPRSTDTGNGTSPQAVELAQLAVAKQAIEMMLPGESTWQPLKSGGLIRVGTRVRTPPEVRCEFTTSDGSEIRLNGGTELVFSAWRQLELTRGQIMARVVPEDSPFQVAIPEAMVSALAAEFDLIYQPAETLLLVLQGTTQVNGKAASREIRPGERLTIVKGQGARTESVDELAQLLTTRWVNEILTLKGRDNPEVAKRVNDILAQLGQLKGDFMDESEIRGLGDHCVLPLTHYLQSPRSQKPEVHAKRLMAARIVADLAQPWSIPDLIELLKDKDGEVRSSAALGLQRLTRQALGLKPQQWLRADVKSRHNAYEQWKNWWQENKQRYPVAS